MNLDSTTQPINFKNDVKYLKGVGPRRSQILNLYNIFSISDLLEYYPRKYLDRTTIKKMNQLFIGESVVVVGKVVWCGIKRTRKKSFFQISIDDGYGRLNGIWFNAVSWIVEKFAINDMVALFGKIDFYNKQYNIVHPDFDILDLKEDPINTGQIIPVYSSSGKLKSVGLDSRGFRKIIRFVLNQIDESIIKDCFNKNFLKAQKIGSYFDAIKNIHMPEDQEKLNQAIYRLKYNEHFFIQILMLLKKIKYKNQNGHSFKQIGNLIKAIYFQLNFKLTQSQINVIKEIKNDLLSHKPMNRLIQGDVGCGKTIVALLTSCIIIENKFQVAIMAPTEILVEQHYKEINKLCKKANITCEILLGGMKNSEKKIIYGKLKTGEIELIIGTHSLIQDNVIFKNLGMIIIDEQHRFGVEQRKKLIQKGVSPEILAMTATPIPRTLAFTIHGDMDLSIINELPKNRQPITTQVIEKDDLNKLYNFMKTEMNKGHQCFVIYPLIEESEKLDLKASESGYKNFKENIFKEFNVGYIHGKMNKEDKETQMTLFEEKKIQCLISTTVVEVGINIPNATVMVIENAERFGLTQLHQLRGRIGRGNLKGHCILIKRKEGEFINKRLKIISSTNNGFEISDQDLKVRGPGDFFGTKQHGFIKTKLIDFAHDYTIIELTKDVANQIIKDDPMLSKKKNKGIKTKFLNDYKHMLEFVEIN